jgi:Putative phage holin Dp-1
MTEQPAGEHEFVEQKSKNPLLNDKWYSILEYVARVVLPGMATLYLALSQLWSFPNGPQVVGTIVAVDTFLGLFLGVAMKKYDASDVAHQGTINVIPTDTGTMYSLELNGDPAALADMSKVSFKVNTGETA